MPSVTDYIFNVPEETEFDLLPAATQAFISQLSPEWPDFPMLSTHAVTGRKLLMVRMKAQLAQVQLDQLFINYALDWQVIFIRSAYKIDGDYQVILPVDKATVLPFYNDIQDGVDVNGDAIMRAPTLADTIYLSTYFGTDPVIL
jgi:hypothetical protein